GEQAVLCGGLAALIKNGFELLVNQGISPEHAWLEVAYQLDLIVELIKQFGLEGMLRRISTAARFGSVEAGPTIFDGSARKKMERVLAEIKSGRFARRLNSLNGTDITGLNQRLKNLSSPLLEQAARKYARRMK
ncbi:MAG: ketol-acid reductoisomerase, partial [Candidatus Zixiibacteriota bacterium]